MNKVDIIRKHIGNDNFYDMNGTSMLTNILNAMEEYNEQEVKNSLSPDVAEKILKARDAYVENDMEDVWHHLYSIASPNFDKTEPWKELEKIAGRL